MSSTRKTGRKVGGRSWCVTGGNPLRTELYFIARRRTEQAERLRVHELALDDGRFRPRDFPLTISPAEGRQ